MIDCQPDKTGKKCTRCGWQLHRGGKFPRRNCPGTDTPEARARREAELAVLPGHQLQRPITRWLGQQAVLGCGCGSMIAKMNGWGVAGCREHLEEIVDRLVEVATEKHWRLADEPGVDPAVIGQPVPQTRRTRFLRLLARAMATTSTGAALVRDRCRAMVLLAIRLAERAKR